LTSLLDKTIVYSYNSIGNITSAKTYAYTTNATPTGSYTEETYTYGNSIQTDRLTNYNGTSISYNTIGGVSSYNGWTHGWSKGKLSYLEKTSSARAVPLESNTKTYSFSYNSLGQRTLMRYSYVVSNSSTPLQDGELTDYTKKFDYDNAGRLIHEKNTKTLTTIGTKYTEITYLYDESGIIGMVYGTSSSSPVTYYFLRNLQGDVVAIYNTSGTRIVEYAYDAYGNCTVIYAQNTALAEDNPIRYRGYYFDVDTGLYCINSRYYSPEWRRFISPDQIGALNPNAANGLNLYCYANNNPVGVAYSSSGVGASGGIVSSTGGTFSNIVGSGSVVGGAKVGTLGSLSGSSFGSINWPKANSVAMIHYTTPLIENAFIGSFFGNISYTVTTQLNDSEMFYSYSDIGNGGCSAGVGMNLENWYGISAYVSSNLGLGTSMQLTPWITYGAEISLLDGISFSFGTISGNTTQEITANVGWGAIAGAYLVCAGIAAIPMPGARALAGAAACLTLLIDIFN